MATGVAQVGHERAGDAGGVHAVVFVETFVFDRDDCFLHDVGDVRAGHDDALLVVEVRDDGSRGVKELRLLGGGDCL